MRLLSACFLLSFIIIPVSVFGQIEPPNRKVLFQEDSKESKKLQKQKEKEVLTFDAPSREDVDIKAPKIEYLQDKDQVKASGGVLLSQQGMQVQSDNALINTKTKDSDLSGAVVVSTSDATISGDTASFNLEQETGKFADSDLEIEDGLYHIHSENTDKLSEYKYTLLNGDFTTCHCGDGAQPWSISSSESHITEGGYAHTYGTKFRVFDVPFFYAPYFAFPVKEERQSGLLVPEFGYSKKDGFKYSQPIYMVLDDHSDLTFTPFTETKTRNGLGLDARKVFSEYNSATGRLIYSDESPRNGDLRGAITNDIFDPKIDEDRYGAYYGQTWRSDPDAPVPLAFVSDIHYISDNLLLRELDEEQIGPRESRDLTSTVLLRGSYSDFLFSEIGGSYNQSIVEDQDLIFQRLPDFTLNLVKRVKPFENPYGIKLVPHLDLLSTRFQRDKGYDGARNDIYPNLGIPFHYYNYFSGGLSAGYRQTYYHLDNTRNPGTDLELESSNDRGLFNSGLQLQTAFERVYDLPEDNFLTTVTGLGSESQSNVLKRVKHTVTPSFRYNFVPDVTQDDLPLFDELDRIRERSLFSFGLKTAMVGRFLPRNVGTNELTELTPQVKDIPTIDFNRPLFDYGRAQDLYGAGGGGDINNRIGETRELLSLAFVESYDSKEDSRNRNPDVNSWSDLGTVLALAPTKYVGFNFDANIDTQENEFSSWGAGTQLTDDRGDALRGRFIFIDQSISQLEGNAEIALTELVKIGYYARFDDKESEFIDNRVALRLVSSCDCWKLDFGYADTINPDKQQFFLRVTLAGLGDIVQKFSRDS